MRDPWTISASAMSCSTSGSLLLIRRIPREHDPSASKMPARNPACHVRVRRGGTAMIRSIASTSARRAEWIAVIARRVSVAAVNTRVWVVTPSASRSCRVRSSASPSARARRKAMDLDSATVLDVAAMEDHPVAANHAGEVSTPILARPARAESGTAAKAETLQSIVRREERALQRPAHRARHVLPAAVGEEPMVSARRQLGAVGERDAVRPLSRRPFRQHSCPDVSPIVPLLFAADDLLPDRQLIDAPLSPIGAEDERLRSYAVDARMRASAVRVHGPVERHRRGAGHVVERRLGHHLVEGHAGELRSGDGADEAIEVLEPGKGRGIRNPQLLSLPSHGIHSNRRTNEGQAVSNKVTMLSDESPLLRAVDAPAGAREWRSDTSGDAPRCPRGPPAHGRFGSRAPCSRAPRETASDSRSPAWRPWRWAWAERRRSPPRSSRPTSPRRPDDGRRRAEEDRIAADAAACRRAPRADPRGRRRTRRRLRGSGIRRRDRRGRRRGRDRRGGGRRGVPRRGGDRPRGVRRRSPTPVASGRW